MIIEKGNNRSVQASSIDFGNIGIDEITSEAEHLLNNIAEASESKGLFTVKTADRWIEQAKTRPIPKMLFGEFWFEGELCILFADSNVGKSILAVQIGDSISKGSHIAGFKLEAPRQSIIYFDFELSDKQFETRYSKEFKEHYSFSSNFFRAEINADDSTLHGFSCFEDYLNDSLEKAVVETGAKVLIIDNLTYLRTENEKAKDALPLMKNLKGLKNKYGLSIMALAHTPKRDFSKPITGNDLQGSKMLMNFCDSAFSIGQSHKDKSTRYLKQIKSRNTEIIYDTENVCLCQLDKPHNFLQFEFLDFGYEQEHLRQLSDKDKKQAISEVMELKEQGIPNTEIARRYGVSEGAIRKWIKKFNAIQPE
ncbi:MAG: AAA family ATPase [Bacteroidetes bacterium]|nr:AAA family ATPase [Bacteroidota bacterium]MBT4399540.1 AAA family ATPase [Bacteroidota bacterium]MBT4408683.1 AAA family ATPase [Bacteroidota bacterium]MBT5427357.1 AAA family ATPase [Bacteroidota bacterium]